MLGVTTNVPLSVRVQVSPVQFTVSSGLNKLAQASKSNTNVGAILAVWQGMSTQYKAKLLDPEIGIPALGEVFMHNLKLQERDPFDTVPSRTMVADMAHGPGACARKK